MKVYAVIPARSGSKGLSDKNIRLIAGQPLIKYSIDFALGLPVIDRVFCSTDSEKYASIARKYGAEVPFLRSKQAASDTAMEPEVLVDIRRSFQENGIEEPDLLVWLRPTFVFRSSDDVKACIELMVNDISITAARTVCESESRLYSADSGVLAPMFDDQRCSMIRRQDIWTGYKVFSTDVFRFKDNDFEEDFLGRNVAAVPINKLCGLDIDDQFDFDLVESIIKAGVIDVSKFSK